MDDSSSFPFRRSVKDSSGIAWELQEWSGIGSNGPVTV
jgi:hypothetical protein